MMYTLLALIITAGELLAVLGSHLLHSQNVFYNAMVYGSPFYLLMNLLNADSAIMDANPLFIGLLIFHLLKYFIFWRARRVEEPGGMLLTAIIFEALYLGLSAYYIN